MEIIGFGIGIDQNFGRNVSFGIGISTFESFGIGRHFGTFSCQNFGSLSC
jgi:hypothetical protein